MKFFFFYLFALLYAGTSLAQTGLTVGPPRLYFVTEPGQSQNQTVEVSNPSKDYALELNVSFNDWAYALNGDNVISKSGTLPTTCASWISVSEPFFTLNPGETKTLNVNMQLPPHLQYSDSIPIHTAMLFVTQLNPKRAKDREGANIQIAVRSGIKIYHRFNNKNNADLEITNLRYLQQDSVGSFMEVSYISTGNVWIDGEMTLELINQTNGQKTKIDSQGFFCLPHDKRKHFIELPSDLATADYVASLIINYGANDHIKIGELEFTHAKSL